MKIGIDGRFWNETGVGRYIRNLVEELAIIDPSNEYVIFMRREDASDFKSPNQRWSIVPTDIHWHSLREQIEFPKLIKKYHLDLMHFTYFSVPIRYTAPYVVTIHDLILHHFSTGEATTLPKYLYIAKVIGYKYIISQAAQKARKIITVSEATKEEIVDHLKVPNSKIAVTYEGVDKELLPRRSSGSATHSGKYFLHVGNVYPHKNAKILVHAFKEAHCADTKLVFVGKKDYFMKDLERYVSTQKIAEVEFLGFVPDEELAVLYRNALATVVPSRMEGFGLPVLEAMTNNSLVIASNIPSLTEIGEDGVLYCDPNSQTDITEKMQMVATAPGKYDGLKKKGVTIAKKYTWKKMAEQTLQIYESSASIRPSQ